MPVDLIRRRMIIGAAGLLLTSPTFGARLLQPTPEQMLGPFYPPEPPLDNDNDLTSIRGHKAIAKGRIADVSGRLLNSNGQPIRGTRIEIWQCDAMEHYHHPRDRSTSIDQNFQGFGHTMTDGEGRYRFRTIHPVPYPGRAPHIHFAVRPRGAEPFITQLYVKGEPLNTSDFLFQDLPADKQSLLLAEFVPVNKLGDLLKTSFDIVLAR